MLAFCGQLFNILHNEMQRKNLTQKFSEHRIKNENKINEMQPLVFIQKHSAVKGWIFSLYNNNYWMNYKNANFWLWQHFDFTKNKIDRINKHLNITSNNNTHGWYRPKSNFVWWFSYFKRMRKKIHRLGGVRKRNSIIGNSFVSISLFFRYV